MVDETCNVAGTEVFRDAAVDGNEAFLAVSLEQIGLKGTSIYSFGCEVFSVFAKCSRADLIFTSFEPLSR